MQFVPDKANLRSPSQHKERASDTQKRRSELMDYLKGRRGRGFFGQVCMAVKFLSVVLAYCM